MNVFDLVEGYRSARGRISALVNGAGLDAVAGRTVPATPAWTVHQLVAHLRGEVADVAEGNLDGAPGDQWTAKQVERFGAVPLPVLLVEWDDEARFVEDLLR